MQLKLEPYQRQSVDFIKKTPFCGLFLEPGLGKTAVTLTAIYELAKERQLPHGHILVIAPKNIARSTWIDEMKKWGFNFRYKSLIVNEKGKDLSKKAREKLFLEALTEKPTIYFINRELVKTLVDFYVDRSEETRKRYPKGRYNYSQGWIFKTVIIDELQSFKSYKSQRFLSMKCICAHIDRFIGLTGTPAPNGLEDLWAEIFLMDKGARLGKNITEFRKKFMDPGLVIKGNLVNYKPKPGAKEAVYELIKDLAISMENTILNLPSVTYSDTVVHMNDIEYAMYKTFAKKRVVEVMHDDNMDTTEITAANAASLHIKLSQIASGAIYLDDEASKSSAPAYKVIHEHKLEYLEYIVNNTSSPVLVAYHFKSDKDMICKYFEASKDLPDVTVFDGSPEMLHAWNRREIPVMLIQPQSAGHGLNFQQGGHTLVWYTITCSLEEYIQTNARLHRNGQTHPVTIHHLLADKTIDRHILDRVLKKDADERELLDAVKLAIEEIKA